MKKTVTMLLAAALFLLALTPTGAAASYSDSPYPERSDHYYYHDYRDMRVGETASLAHLMTAVDSEDGLYPVGPRNWASEKPEIATVTADGTVTALNAGVAEIAVTYRNNRSERVTETVRLRVKEAAAATAPAYALSVNQEKAVDLREFFFPGAGEGSYQWKVKDDFLAEVDADGLLLAEVAGSGSVSAAFTDQDGNVTAKSASLEVTAEHHGSLNQFYLTLAPGETIDLGKALFPEERYISYACRSDKDSVVSIGEDQLVTGNESGDCVVILTGSFRGDEEFRQKVHITVR